MKFPDPNIGYVFGYDSKLTDDGILITFLGGIIKILFQFKDIEYVSREVYRGGRISWDVIRWGKCPPGTEALKVILKKGIFKNHLIVFDNLDDTIRELRNKGVDVR